MNYLLSDIVKIINGIPGLRFKKDVSISHLLIDSRPRETGNPENTLFFAIKGERNNGHAFIGELFNRGIKNFVVSDTPPEMDANFIILMGMYLFLVGVDLQKFKDAHPAAAVNIDM